MQARPVNGIAEQSENESRGTFIFQQNSGDLVEKIKRKAWRKSWKHIYNFYTQDWSANA